MTLITVIFFIACIANMFATCYLFYVYYLLVDDQEKFIDDIGQHIDDVADDIYDRMDEISTIKLSKEENK